MGLAIHRGMNHEGGTMKNPHEVDLGTRLMVIATLLLLALVALGTMAWQAYGVQP